MIGALPRFGHDCPNCVFLGPYGDLDVYVCPQSGFPTVILRYGGGGDYYSGRHLVPELPDGIREEAVRRMDEWEER